MHRGSPSPRCAWSSARSRTCPAAAARCHTSSPQAGYLTLTWISSGLLQACVSKQASVCTSHLGCKMGVFIGRAREACHLSMTRNLPICASMYIYLSNLGDLEVLLSLACIMWRNVFSVSFEPKNSNKSPPAFESVSTTYIGSCLAG